MLDRLPEAPRPQQRMAYWSPEMERLTDLVDLVRELIRVVAATRGAKPKKITPMPRPVTAIDRVRNRRREQMHRRLVARVLPHKAAEV